MENKRCNRQIALAAILLVLVLAFLGLLVWKLTYDWRAQRHLDQVPVELQPTAVHSQADLEAAAEAVTRHMSSGCKFDLERIWYDPAQAGPLERDAKSQYGILQPEDVVVLFADVRDMPAPGPAGEGDNQVMVNAYRYTLMREEDGGWYVFSEDTSSRDPSAFVTPTPAPTP